MSGTFQSLMDAVSSYMSKDDVKRIEEAYTFSEKAHDGQKRQSGKPYISHPLTVAGILADLRQDVSTICAGLLHDTVEDTGVTLNDIEKKFGHEIMELVDGVTKLGKLSFDSREEAQAENFRKMFLAMAKDIRVVVVKLADRLHNMRTLSFLTVEKQRRIARETLEIFAPLAHRMGIWSLKWELEDLAFAALDPDAFKEVKRLVSDKRNERENYISSFINLVKDLLKKHAISADIIGRPKHFYSIHQKLRSDHISFEELYDQLGLRIIVNEVQECYQVLGLIHSQFKPISGRIKDYIAVPKSNFYQSLHTTVIGPSGKPVEIQIRTQHMHQVAEFGVAAHWRYKNQDDKSMDFSWLRDLLDLHQDNEKSTEFMQELKLDLFIEEVFVFSPKGDVIVLPQLATPVDFAYRIHTEVGHMCTGAKVNGHIVPLDYHLQSGDRIEIITGKVPRPKLDWLQFVQTSQAKTRIKQWIRRQQRDEQLTIGQEKLEKVLLMSGYDPKKTLSEDNIKILNKHFGTSGSEGIYFKIAHGEIRPREIVSFFEDQNKPLPSNEKLIESLPKRRQQRLDNIGVSVLGEDNISVRLSKCCNPLPGDPIIGFVTIGAGVSIHRTDCRHIFSLNDQAKARLVDVEWDYHTEQRTFPITIVVEAFERLGMLQDILQRIQDHQINVNAVRTSTIKNKGLLTANITLEVNDLKQLQHITKRIKDISDVISVRRVYHD